ncbi:MAG: DUF2095 family protein [Candidatus Bathyarchaeota archaeon]|nr:DUF2095 family protein [Candidatus Bathyarchaeota archaeon]MCZ2844904.1 DUF2095 family protein [Candidatus Bathyarchaeota archaeon]
MDATLVEMDRVEFKKKFPMLFKEIESKKVNININEVNGSNYQSKELFRGYMPTAIDYLRRCDTDEQAEKTIEYLLKNREITESYGKKLKRVLKKKGIRGFGPRKEDGYYLRKAGIID